MKKTKVIEYPDEVFDQARNSFKVVVLSFSKELEKMQAEDILSRYNRIKICLSYRNIYTYPILFLKVFRVASEIGGDNFYSWPLHIENLTAGYEYEIEFLHFDAFNLPFESIEVSIMLRDEYSKRKLNTNAANRAKMETIRIDRRPKHFN